ncbi:hypothetical protein [Companilactobacillus bobalius]|uniref:Uncharacterized protein n=2 Tax=Companilactobacillus bobalius TaxID=2801451 RepID=A0A202FFR7_9LACO|nr:hypothetical protein [Companilactobacillus bobalius]KAE9560302.1 hypothetical protein ATN92_09030 [Companilactobacillus bobalius]KRK83040.1 hypothetical protein FC78_GL001848 [Companilactobacillus bobalius DSM 19674]OVE99272.1 hypothetical protein LKACC16343_00384 [Companilactobacillus bobalius]
MEHYKYKFTYRSKVTIKTMPNVILFFSAPIIAFSSLFIQRIPQNSPIIALACFILISYYAYLGYFFAVMKITINSSFKNVDDLWDILLYVSQIFISISAILLGITIWAITSTVFNNMLAQYAQVFYLLFYVFLITTASCLTFVLILPTKKTRIKL